MRIERYDCDWGVGIVSDPNGRFIKLEQAEQALRQAAEMLAAAGRRPVANELREATQRLERHDYEYYPEWGVGIAPDPDGRFVRTRDVARHLRDAAEQLDRAGHWAGASELMRLVDQLEAEGDA